MNATEMEIMKFLAVLGTSLGGSFTGWILAAKLWVHRTEGDIAEVKKQVGDLSEDVEMVRADVAALKSQGDTLRKLDESVAALHRRFDEHTRDEAVQRADIARELGSLTSAVRIALGGKVDKV